MHRFIRNAALMLALAGSTVLTGCGDDPAAPSTGDPLTEVEAQGLFEVVMLAALDIPTVTADAALMADGVPGVMAFDEVDESIDASGECAMGGSVRMVGAVTGDVDENGYGTLSLNADLIHDDCRGQGAQGPVFAINGDPKIVLEADMTFDEDAFSITESVEGNVAWETTDKQGTCRFDLNYSIESTATTLTGSVSGSICGQNLNQNF